MTGTILFVDDDKNLVQQVGDFLAFQGYQVIGARDGQEGLDKLAQVQPDLVILDMNMPQLGGVGFLKALRATKIKHPPAVVVFTARANMGDFFESMDVAAYLTKPCEPDLLLKTVGDALAKRSAARQAAEARPRQSRALLAEDDLAVAERLAGRFRLAGWEVGQAASGPAALEQAIVWKPDVIVAKVILTGMNGDKLAQALSELPNTQAIPIVLYDDSGQPAPASKYVTGRTGVRALVIGNAASDLLAAATRALDGKSKGVPPA